MSESLSPKFAPGTTLDSFTTGRLESAAYADLVASAPKHAGFHRCIAFDFDGVLHSNPHWSSKWADLDFTLIDQTHARSMAVAIMTCNDTWRIAELLRRAGYVVTDDNADPVGGSLKRSPSWHGGTDGKRILVTNRKVCAHRYVDDKAVEYHYEEGPDSLWSYLARREGYRYCAAGTNHWGPDGAAGLLPWTSHAGRTWVLLARRSANVQGGACWSTIGGAVEPGEMPLDGACREAGEEINGLAGAQVGYDDPSYTAFCGNGCGWFYQTFPAYVPAGDMLPECSVNKANGWETTDVRWFPLDVAVTLPDLHAGLQAAFPHLIALFTDSETTAAS
jgi:8-oxo-dGTP diphosphatase